MAATTIAAVVSCALTPGYTYGPRVSTGILLVRLRRVGRWLRCVCAACAADLADALPGLAGRASDLGVRVAALAQRTHGRGREARDGRECVALRCRRDSPEVRDDRLRRETLDRAAAAAPSVDGSGVDAERARELPLRDVAFGELLAKIVGRHAALILHQRCMLCQDDHSSTAVIVVSSESASTFRVSTRRSTSVLPSPSAITPA